MKIIESVPNLNSGGGEKLVVDLSEAFYELGHECEILTLFAPSEGNILASQVNPQIRKDHLDKHLGFDIKCLFRFWRYVEKEKPDVVHAHLDSNKYVLLTALLYRRCRYYATIHSEAKKEAGQGFAKYVRRFLFNTGLVTPVTISEESELSFEHFYGYKAAMIPNGTSPYKPGNNIESLKRYHENVDFLFIHAGRLNPVKNQKMLIEAIEQLRQDGCSCRLLILGRNEPGEVLDYINMHCSDTIMYLGEVANVRDYISISDCFCLSSFFEGLPITILEAYSVGCPVVATPVGGCVNVVNVGVTGFLSADVSKESYIEALRKMISLNGTQYQEMREQCIKEYETKFSIHHCASKYVELFKNKQ